MIIYLNMEYDNNIEQGYEEVENNIKNVIEINWILHILHFHKHVLFCFKNTYQQSHLIKRI